MESRQCVICGINFELKTENIPLTIVNNKILFDSCLHLFKIKEKSYNDIFKWKWDARFDSPNFCEICCTNIQTLSELDENLKLMLGKRKIAALESQIIILNSTTEEKRNFRKKLTDLIEPGSLSVINKIDYFRSTVVQAWNPVISIKRCDEKKESDDIIDIGVPRNLTKEEIDQIFYDAGDKFQCKICSTVIKEKRNIKRHINDIHLRVKRFKCKFCQKMFYTKSKCKSHIHKEHGEISPPTSPECSPKPISPPVSPSPQTSKCLLCYKSVEDENVQIPSEVLDSFSCLLNVNPPNFMAEFAISCVSCSSYLIDLHDLKCHLEQVENEFAKLLLKVKTDVLTSISSSTICQMIENGQLGTEQINSAKKINHFQRLAVQDFIPVICLFNIKTGISNNHQERTPHEYSVFKLIKEEEIISIMNNGTENVFLTNEELLNYFQNDGEKYRCQLCGGFFSSIGDARAHYNKFHRQMKRFKCKYCANAFYYRGDCARHILSHKMERVEIEAEIEKNLKSQSDIIRTSDGVISIPRRSDITLSKDDIIKIEKKAYKCGICSQIFKNRHIVRIHQLRVHLKIYRYECEFCGLKNHHKHQILYHIRRVHPEKQKLIDRISNGKTTAPPPHLAKKLSKPKFKRAPFPLLRGMKVLEAKTIHKMEEQFTFIGCRYSCKICGREFTVRNILFEHIEKVHFGVRRYQCEVCAKKFYNYSACKKHLHKHNPDHLDIVDNSARQEKSCLNVSIEGETVDGVDSNTSVVVDAGYQNDEEQPIEIPFKVEIEVNASEFDCSIDFEDAFIQTKNNVQIVDCSKNSIEYVSPDFDKTEGNANDSSGDVEVIVGLDNDKKLPTEKCLLYKLIKPGEIIELPRSPNYAKNRKKGYKKVPDGFKCLKCHRVFKKRTIFLGHWGVVHDKSGGYQCSVCQRRYYGKFHCAQHFIHKHTSRNPFVCSICDEKLYSKPSLKAHVQKHMGERRFTCSMCRLKFISETRLIQHNENVHMKILGS